MTSPQHSAAQGSTETSDTALVQAAHDVRWQRLVGKVSSVEFEAGPPAQVRVEGSKGRFDRPAHLAAVVENNTWTWSDSEYAAEETPIAGPAESAQLTTLARARYGNGPALFAPHPRKQGRVLLYVLDGGLDPSVTSTRDDIMSALSHLSATTDFRPQLARYAEATRQDMALAQDGTAAQFPDGTEVQFDRAGLIIDVAGPRGRSDAAPEAPGAQEGRATYSDILADAYFFGVEVNQFLNGTQWPGSGASAALQLDDGTVEVSDPFRGRYPLQAHPLAETSQGWDWLNTAPARHVRDFAWYNGVPQLMYQYLPRDVAERWMPWLAARPILHAWGQRSFPVASPRGQLMVSTLFEDPALALPQPSSRVFSSLLGSGLPAGLDTPRAIASYARFRGVGITPESSGLTLHFVDGDASIPFANRLNEDGAE